MPALDLLYKNSVKTTYTFLDDNCKYIYYGAAQSGNLALFKWMKSQGYPFNSKACEIAAENGHWHIIDWILDRTSEWSEYDSCRNWLHNIIAPAAAKNGHLNILEQLNTEDWSSCLVIEEAIENGHVHILNWIKSKRLVEPEYTHLLQVAAKSGKVEVMEWLLDNYEYNWDFSEVMEGAVASGNFEMIKYCKAKFLGINCGAPLAIAAKYGHFDVLKWLHESGHPWDVNTVENAAEGGHLAIVQWLIEKNCPFSPDSLALSAVKGGNLQLIKWIHYELNIQLKNIAQQLYN